MNLAVIYHLNFYRRGNYAATLQGIGKTFYFSTTRRYDL
jgi:hypothetical protein